MDIQQAACLHVFLIEPSHTQQLIIRQHLKACGITDVECLESGSELLRQLDHASADLIMSAMYLPDMTGVELLYEIRKDSTSYEMAFILISSETNIEYLDPIRQAGAIAILPKPFEQAELETAIGATINYLHPEKAQLEHFDIEDLQVLVVDDSPFARKFITRILNDIGIEHIVSCSDGNEALSQLHQHHFDLVVTDYNMPEVDGLQLVQAIRRNPEYLSTPILMVTSEQNQNRLAAVEKAGVSAVLDKPFEPTSIKRLIVQLLE